MRCSLRFSRHKSLFCGVLIALSYSVGDGLWQAPAHLLAAAVSRDSLAGTKSLPWLGVDPNSRSAGLDREGIFSDWAKDALHCNGLAQGEKYPVLVIAAADTADVRVLTLLLDAGANINATGGPQEPALMAAVLSGHFEDARLLLAHGANVKVRWKDGTPLTEMTNDPRTRELLERAGVPTQ